MPIDLDLRVLLDLEKVWQAYNWHSREHARELVRCARRSLAQIELKVEQKRFELDHVEHEDENASRRIDQIEHSIDNLQRISNEVSSALAQCEARLVEVEVSTTIGKQAGLSELSRMVATARKTANAGEIDHGMAGGSDSPNEGVHHTAACHDTPSGRLPKGFVWVNLESIPTAEYEQTVTDRSAHFDNEVMSSFLQKELPRLAEFVTERGFVDYDRLIAIDRSERKSVTEGMEAAARAFFGDEPIVIDTRGGNTVTNGKHRLRLAEQLGLRFVPVKKL